MLKSLLVFTWWMVAFTVAMGLAMWLAIHRWPFLAIPHIWVILAGIAVLSYVAGAASVLGGGIAGPGGAFVMLGALVLKMLAAMGFAAWYVVKVKNPGIVFGLEYFALYIVFTAFEMYALLTNLRHQNNKRKTPINER